ncbi:MAG: hypothetical protein R3D34_16895 [Nitratireductor sp.]
MIRKQIEWQADNIHEMADMLRGTPECKLVVYLLEIALLEISDQLAKEDNLAMEKAASTRLPKDRLE